MRRRTGDPRVNFQRYKWSDFRSLQSYLVSRGINCRKKMPDYDSSRTAWSRSYLLAVLGPQGLALVSDAKTPLHHVDRNIEPFSYLWRITAVRGKLGEVGVSG